MIRAFLILAALAFPAATASPPVEYSLARQAAVAPELIDHICGNETGDKLHPDRTVNQYGSAWGRCQIKYWSAVYFGGFDEQLRITGIPSRSPAELFDPVVNVQVGRMILDHCRRRYPGASDRHLAYCWLAGPNSKSGANEEGRLFAKRVAIDVAHAEFKLLFVTAFYTVKRERVNPCYQNQTTLNAFPEYRPRN